jgi:3-oxoacyl-[acyl-carrier protein] reductase
VAVALLVGGLEGARGLVADALAAEGWALALNYPTGRAAAERRVAGLRDAGTPAVGLFATLDQEGTGGVLVQRTIEALGRLDAVVLDPPPVPGAAFANLKQRGLDDVLAAGLLGPHRVLRAALGDLAASEGRVVVVARGGGTLGGLVGGGLASWAAVLGEELAAEGVAVGCVAVDLPGPRLEPTVGGEEAVAAAVVGLLTGERPPPGGRVDVASHLSSRP